MANQTITGLSSIASPSSSGLLWIADTNASPVDRSFSLAALVTYLQAKIGFGNASAVALSSTPYTLSTAVMARAFLVTTGASAFVFNLPAASSWVGYAPITIIKADSGAGIVQVAPNGTDVIDKAGNVSLYLGGQWQSLTLEASVSGYWTVVGGTFSPHQTVDTDGTQYQLGKLRHLPLGNTTDRGIGGAMVVPAVSSWYGSAITATGVVGVPIGAKAVRIRVRLSAYAAAAGNYSIDIAFSDNNANTPTFTTGHPLVNASGYAAAAGTTQISLSEIDVPLNSSGQCYFYALTESNITAGSSTVRFIVVGYYMGD